MFCKYLINDYRNTGIAMHHNKDSQKEIILIEAAVWVFWILFFIVVYLS